MDKAVSSYLRGLYGMALISSTLTGCSAVLDSAESFFVQPGKFDLLDCRNLELRAAAASARETELAALMARADQDVAGPLVNALVYAADFQQVRAELRSLQRTARDKGCSTAVPNPQQQPAIFSTAGHGEEPRHLAPPP